MLRPNGEVLEFGRAVSIDGDTAVVGTPGSAAYVFVRSGGDWVQQARLVPADGVARGEFGTAVAIDADTILVGAPSARSGTSHTGVVYAFVRSGVAWHQQAVLAPGATVAARPLFGQEVALDGNTAVVGAPLETLSPGGPAAGVAYAPLLSGSSWAQQAVLRSPDPVVDAGGFGFAVAVDGDTAVVGEPLDGIDRRGAAFVFVRAAGSWGVGRPLAASTLSYHDEYGFAVAMDDDTILVGSPSTAPTRTTTSCRGSAPSSSGRARPGPSRLACAPLTRMW